jgi:lipopolysaccharide/colanic/teichoic acid biosynthesis glycosyltransferase
VVGNADANAKGKAGQMSVIERIGGTRAERIVAPQPMTLRALRGLAYAAPQAAPVTLGTLAKRALDVAGALSVIAVTWPLMLVVAIAIKLDSPGPVFISQVRVRDGLKKFQMLKFRSMVVNADELLPLLDAFNEATPPLFKMRNDPRITRVGRWLRRLSIDELPQLFNVFWGEMSLVGPRPPLPQEVEFDRRRQSIRLRHRPGMTGLWQVSGRSDLGYEDMISLDLRYVRDWSFGLDLEILARTPAVVLTGRGAR